MNRVIVAFGVVFIAALLIIAAVRMQSPVRDSAWQQGAEIRVQPGKPVVSPSGIYLLSLICSDELSALSKCHFLIRRIPGGTLEEMDPFVEFAANDDIGLFWTDDDAVIMHYRGERLRWEKEHDVWISRL